MKQSILNINELSIGYKRKNGHLHVCDHLNAEIGSGELICLLGENGSGKSTLIRTLSGFQPAISGEGTILGKNLFSIKEKEMALLTAVVLTDRIDVPNATVEELVSLGRSPFTNLMGRLSKNDKKVVAESIEKCGIRHKANEQLSNLSDGEKQKVFIAKALAQDTPLIILDEPTAFLDLPARVEIIQLLREIAMTSSKSILMSTHDLDLAIQMADKLWLLPKGGPLITGTPEDLLLQNAFEKLFVERGVEFDNKTGLFKVKHKHDRELTVKGHGFEYVLLRRAFARRGIKLTQANDQKDIWLEIPQKGNAHFNLHKEGKMVASETTVEKIVEHTLTYLN